MKQKLQIALTLFLSAIVAIGCESGEKFVTKYDGIWNVQRLNTKTYDNDSLIDDFTATDSLGEMHFLSTGEGARVSAAGVRDTFVWQFDQQDQHLIVYYKHESFMHAKVEDRSPDAMSLFWVTSFDQGDIHVKIERWMDMRRGK